MNVDNNRENYETEVIEDQLCEIRMCAHCLFFSRGISKLNLANRRT